MEIFSSVNKRQKERAYAPILHTVSTTPFTDFSVPVQHIYLKLLIIEIKCYRWKKLENPSMDPCHLVTALLCFHSLSNGLVFGSIFFSQYSGYIFLFCFVCLLFLLCPCPFSMHSPSSGNNIPLFIQCPDLREGKGFIPISILRSLCLFCN